MNFITHIFGDQKGNVVLGLRNKTGADGKVNRYTWFTYPDQTAQIDAFIEQHKGEDVYYSPMMYGDAVPHTKEGTPLPLDYNKNKQYARTPENALTTRVIYSDSDTARPSDFRVHPSTVVETSNGRYHCYWDLVEPVPVKIASELAHRITTAHAKQGSDQNGWSGNKVLRIPGTMNTSHGFPEQVKWQTNGTVYELDEIDHAYADVSTVERAMFRTDLYETITPDNLPPYSDTLDKVSSRTIELALAEPKEGQDRSALRYKLLLELFRDGLTFEEVLTVAWHAPAARKWSQEDARGIAGLAGEAAKAEAETSAEMGAGIEPPHEPEPILAEGETIKLLTDEERARVAKIDTWVKRYVKHAGYRYPKQNKPYDRINAWTALSVAMCDTGFIPRKNGKEGLNLYTMTWGETTTGKSQARKMLTTILDEIMSEDPEYNIGGDASQSALGRKLIERDGRTSYFTRDEAHGALSQWTKQEWASGMLEMLAEIYDGHVAAQLRTGNWDKAGKSARTQFVMHLVGTPGKMIEVLHRDMFASGFLARFQWAIGEPRQVDYNSMAEEDSDGEDILLGYDPMARQFAAELTNAKTKIQKSLSGGATQVGIRIEPDAAKRLQDAKWELNTRFEGCRDWDILEPSIVRLGVTMRKCAALIAMQDGRTVSTLDDVLVAAEACEEWLTNLLVVAAQVSASDWQRFCDQVEEFVFKQDNHTAKREQVARRFKAWESFKLDSYIGALISQGRLREVNGEMVNGVRSKLLVSTRVEDKK